MLEPRPATAGGPAAELEGLLLQLLAAESPNPPGDVAAATDVVRAYCDASGLPCHVDRPVAGRQNLVIKVLGGARDSDAGPHLVWNGHLDTFPPVGHPPRVHAEGGRVHGRGAVDMKGGVAALLVAARLLRHETHAGRLTLTLVCDEETFGPHGARHLLDHRPELLGDALVSAEPSSLGLVRIAERGFLWLKLRFAGESRHSAYPSSVDGAIVRMAALVQEVRASVGQINERLRAGAAPRTHADEALDHHLGDGAAATTRAVTLNVGMVRGGSAVNLQPDDCEVTLDLRIPDSLDPEEVLTVVTHAAARTSAVVDVLGRGDANATPPSSAIVREVVEAVTVHTGHEPMLSTGLGCTDTRLWRYAGVPACVVGPSPATMGAEDEFVELAELETLVGVLVDATRAYLAGGG